MVIFHLLHTDDTRLLFSDVFTLLLRQTDADITANCEYLPGSASLPSSPVAPVAPSSAVASRLARSCSDSQAEKGTGAVEPGGDRPH